MHAPLAARDSLADRRHVLAVGLGVAARGRAFRQLVGLERVAGVDLVADGYGHDPQTGDVRSEVFALLVATEREHLDHRRFGPIDAVLGPPFALGDPYGLVVGLHGMADVVRQQLRCRQQLPGTFRGPLHHEALVQAHEISDPALREQVVANRNAQRAMASAMQRIVGQRGIHRDVPVIADKEVGLGRVQRIEARNAETRGRSLDHAFDVALDEHLQIVDAFYTPELPTQVKTQEGAQQPGKVASAGTETKAQQSRQKVRRAEQAIDSGAHFFVVEGPYGCEGIGHPGLQKKKRPTLAKLLRSVTNPMRVPIYHLW